MRSSTATRTSRQGTGGVRSSGPRPIRASARSKEAPRARCSSATSASTMGARTGAIRIATAGSSIGSDSPALEASRSIDWTWCPPIPLSSGTTAPSSGCFTTMSSTRTSCTSERTTESIASGRTSIARRKRASGSLPPRTSGSPITSTPKFATTAPATPRGATCASATGKAWCSRPTATSGSAAAGPAARSAGLQISRVG